MVDHIAIAVYADIYAAAVSSPIYVVAVCLLLLLLLLLLFGRNTDDW